MTSRWDYGNGVALDDRDLTGYSVEATDGSIGKIDESNAATGQSYVVVDTGFWIFDKKRLIPAGVVQRIDHDAEKVFVGLSKEQVKLAPDFDESHLEVRDECDAYYNSYSP